MADKWPSANGNWSNAANWNGGTLPQPGDDVYADGKTIAIDQDVTSVATIRTTQRSGGTIGGGFTCNAAVTITCTAAAALISSASAPVITFTHAAGTTVALNASFASPTGSTVVHSGTGTLNITGNLSPTNQGASNCVSVSGGGVVNLVGNIVAWGGANQTISAINVNTVAGAVITVVGSVASGSAGSCHGIAIGQNTTITITGALLSGGQNCVNLGSTSSTLTVTGSVTAAAGSAIASSGSAIITVTGDVTGGSNDEGIDCSGGVPIVTVYGSLIATSWFPAVAINVAAGIGVFTGPLIGHSSGRAPFWSRRVFIIDPTQNYLRVKNANAAATLDLVTTDQLAGMPAANDVRAGTSYAAGTMTGTMAVPHPSQVRTGTAVDDTVGTGGYDPAPLWAYLVANATTPGSIGELVGRLATLASVGAVLAAADGRQTLP